MKKQLLIFLLPILFSCVDQMEDSNLTTINPGMAVCPDCEPGDPDIGDDGVVHAELSNGLLKISFTDKLINQFIPREYSSSPYHEPVHYKDYGGSFVYFELRKIGHAAPYISREDNYFWKWSNSAIKNTNYYLLDAYYNGDYGFGETVFGGNIYNSEISTNASNLFWGTLYNSTLPSQTNDVSTNGYIEIQTDPWSNNVSPLVSGEITKDGWSSTATYSGPAPSTNYDNFKNNGLTDGIYEALFFVEFHQKGGEIGINIISAYQTPVSIKFQILNGALVILNSNTLLAPGNLISPSQTDNSVSLTWTDNSNNEDGFYVIRNNIRVATLPANSTSTTISGLASNTSYTFAIEAFNSSDIAHSSSLTVQTEEMVSNAVTVDVSGPLSLPFGGTGTYTAHTTGTVNYIRWYIMYEDENSFTHLYNYEGMASFGTWFTKSFTLKCVINNSVEDTLPVFVQSKNGGGLLP